MSELRTLIYRNIHIPSEVVLLLPREKSLVAVVEVEFGAPGRGLQKMIALWESKRRIKMDNLLIDA